MCTTQEGNSFMQPRKKGLSKICMKCSEKAVVVVRGLDTLCRSCFLTYITHKFRSTLGKAKVIRQGEKVLLAVSGGQASSALLQMIREGLEENVHKKLRFIPAVAHIMEDAKCFGDRYKEATLTNMRKIKEMVTKANFRLHLISLEESLQGREESIDDNKRDSEDSPVLHNGNSILQDKITMAKSSSAMEDLMENLRIQLLTSFARQHGYTKILLGDSSTRLSVKVLSNTALGKGGCVPLDIGVADARSSDAILVRPLREVSSKEIAFYNVFQGVGSTCLPRYNEKLSEKLSLQRQTEYFINELQVNFPSTVNTVFRTGDKLRINQDLLATSKKCILCQSPILSTQRCHFVEENISSTDVAVKDLTGNKYRSSDKELCYGCLITVQETDFNLAELPLTVSETEPGILTTDNLRTQIEDFLLE